MNKIIEISVNTEIQVMLKLYVLLLYADDTITLNETPDELQKKPQMPYTMQLCD